LQSKSEAVDDQFANVDEEASVRRANIAESTLLARLVGGPLDLGCGNTISVNGVRSSARLARRFPGGDAGRGALRELEAWMRETTVVQISDRENPFSDPGIIELLNPTVYSAVTQFAQLAAFFRYVQATDPSVWAAFIKQVMPARAALPSVTLPTCVP
jgi:hypothetical protein